MVCLEDLKVFSNLSKGQGKVVQRYVGLTIVNSEIFVRVLFLGNLADAKVRGNKTIAKWQNHSAL